MAVNFVQLPAAGAPLGLKIDTTEVTVNAVVVERQNIMPFRIVTVAPFTVADAIHSVEQAGQGGETLMSLGGRAATAVPVNTATDTVIKATAGRLCRVIVTTPAANPMQIFDNASGHTGTILGALPANPAIGTVYDFQTPAALGITIFGNATNPAVTVTFY